MKKELLITFFLAFQFSNSQTIKAGGSGEYQFNPEKKACITDIQKQKIWRDLKTSQEKLISEGKLLSYKDNSTPPKFIWPMRASSAAPYENVWSISAYVDHDLAFPNKLKDWNCGARTYDTTDGYNHEGTDIFLWPFPQYQQANNQAEIIAAADGIIVYKSDGKYDQNCSMGGDDWNAVYLQHSDGSITWYGHMKKNSLTTKSVGSTVTAGEYLGIVGSSGNSTGPHLHFEVYNKDNQLVDPYKGSCNNFASNTESWWLEQKPYQDPKINAVLTHSAVPNFNTTCPTVETPLIKNDFNTGDTVYGLVYLADQTVGSVIELKLLRPDNSVAGSSTENISVSFYASYWWWSFPPGFFNVNGEWKLEIKYAGKTVTHKFNYGTNLSTNDKQSSKTIKISPNPANNFIVIDNPTNEIIKTISIADLSGKLIQNISPSNNKIDISSITKGTYMLTIITDKQLHNIKFIKK